MGYKKAKNGSSPQSTVENILLATSEHQHKQDNFTIKQAEYHLNTPLFNMENNQL